MKIDVEGHGGSVLEGAWESLSKFKPKILMELHDGSNERAKCSSLSELGYHFYNTDLPEVKINNKKNRFIVAIAT